MRLEQQIKGILELGLAGAEAFIDRDSESGKVGGRVIWPGFAGSTSLRRQSRIFGLLRKKLKSDESMDISFIFSYTPDEYEQMQSV